MFLSYGEVMGSCNLGLLNWTAEVHGVQMLGTNQPSHNLLDGDVSLHDSAKYATIVEVSEPIFNGFVVDSSEEQESC